MASKLAKEVKNLKSAWPETGGPVHECTPSVNHGWKSGQQSGHVPAAAQMPSVALTRDLSFTSTTASRQLVFPLFLTGNGPRITADRLQGATISLDPPGKHPAAQVMHVHILRPWKKQQPLSAQWVAGYNCPFLSCLYLRH